MHRVETGEEIGGDRVPRLVVGGALAFALADDPALLLRAGHDPFDGLGHLVETDLLLVAARRQQSGLVQDIRQVGAR